jgi:hypothetical protein
MGREGEMLCCSDLSLLDLNYFNIQTCTLPGRKIAGHFHPHNKDIKKN